MRRLTDLVARPDFQRWAARFPLTRRLVRREGEAMFELVAGFVQSQALAALIRLEVLDRLEHWRSAAEIGAETGLPEARAEVLLRAGAAMGLIAVRRGRYRLARRGAALRGVPGLAGMIAHHDVLYRDLGDPVAFFRGEVETELAGFWPYVLGRGDPETAARYSRLMEESQTLVAEDTLDAVSLAGTGRLMDVGGGTGAFLARAVARYPDLRGTVYDLPDVRPAAEARIAARGLSGRIDVVAGSFRDGPLPEAEAISLVRVLYDHSDETVRALLARVRAALPPGGRVIVSEPMTGGDRPRTAGDVYFAVYCLAMGTGRARSADEIGALLREAGFVDIRTPRVRRPFVTSVIEARVSQEA